MDPLTPNGLFNKVQFEVRLHFDRHYEVTSDMSEMTKSSFEIINDSKENLQCVRRTENETKSKENQIVIYELPDSPYCPVQSFKKYIETLDPSNEVLWQVPRNSVKTDDLVWYDGTADIDSLLNFMTDLSHKCKLSKVYSNRSITETNVASVIDTITKCYSTPTTPESKNSTVSNIRITDVQHVSEGTYNGSEIICPEITPIKLEALEAWNSTVLSPQIIPVTPELAGTWNSSVAYPEITQVRPELARTWNKIGLNSEITFERPDLAGTLNSPTARGPEIIPVRLEAAKTWNNSVTPSEFTNVRPDVARTVNNIMNTFTSPETSLQSSDSTQTLNSPTARSPAIIPIKLEAAGTWNKSVIPSEITHVRPELTGTLNSKITHPEIAHVRPELAGTWNNTITHEQSMLAGAISSSITSPYMMHARPGVLNRTITSPEIINVRTELMKDRSNTFPTPENMYVPSMPAGDVQIVDRSNRIVDATHQSGTKINKDVCSLSTESKGATHQSGTKVNKDVCSLSTESKDNVPLYRKVMEFVSSDTVAEGADYTILCHKERTEEKKNPPLESSQTYFTKKQIEILESHLINGRNPDSKILDISEEAGISIQAAALWFQNASDNAATQQQGVKILDQQSCVQESDETLHSRNVDKKGTESRVGTVNQSDKKGTEARVGTVNQSDKKGTESRVGTVNQSLDYADDKVPLHMEVDELILSDSFEEEEEDLETGLVSPETDYTEKTKSGGTRNKHSRRGQRTLFREKQLQALKYHFLQDQNPHTYTIIEIANSIGIKEQVARVWFQNARAKRRRELKMKEKRRNFIRNRNFDINPKFKGQQNKLPGLDCSTSTMYMYEGYKADKSNQSGYQTKLSDNPLDMMSVVNIKTEPRDIGESGKDSLIEIVDDSLPCLRSSGQDMLFNSLQNEDKGYENMECRVVPEHMKVEEFIASDQFDKKALPFLNKESTAKPAEVRVTEELIITDIREKEIGDTVDKEMESVTLAIHTADTRIGEIIGKTNGIDLKYKENILDSCADLISALNILMEKTIELEREIVTQGRAKSSQNEFYKNSHRWTERLLSITRSVGLGVTALIEAADKLVSGEENSGKIIAYSKEIALCTAQLVVALEVKLERRSKKRETLSEASNRVTQNVGIIVGLAQEGLKDFGEQDIILPGPSGINTSIIDMTTKPQIGKTHFRTYFNPEQLKLLQSIFLLIPFPNTDTVIEIAKQIGLKKQIVQSWFRNARARSRRENWTDDQQVDQQNAAVNEEDFIDEDYDDKKEHILNESSCDISSNSLVTVKTEPDLNDELETQTPEVISMLPDDKENSPSSLTKFIQTSQSETGTDDTMSSSDAVVEMKPEVMDDVNLKITSCQSPDNLQKDESQQTTLFYDNHRYQNIPKKKKNYKRKDRPPYTYASLVRQAIIESPKRQLSTSDIYSWTLRTFKHYETEAHILTMKNNIRHALTAHDCFVRLPSDNQGVWAVDEELFDQMKKPHRKLDADDTFSFTRTAPRKTSEINISTEKTSLEPAVTITGVECKQMEPFVSNIADEPTVLEPSVLNTSDEPTLLDPSVLNTSIKQTSFEPDVTIITRVELNQNGPFVLNTADEPTELDPSALNKPVKQFSLLKQAVLNASTELTSLKQLNAATDQNTDITATSQNEKNLEQKRLVDLMSWNVPSMGKTKQLKYVKNKFGRASLVLGGYRYSAKTKKHNRIYWRCAEPSCKATVNTHEGHLVKVGTPHNHPANQTGRFKINESPGQSQDNHLSENESVSEEIEPLEGQDVPLHLECEDVFSVDSEDEQELENCESSASHDNTSGDFLVSH
ncbi:uncharacterized protein LOC134717657 [Mytilus trossulus]|uniref:uncharacterized protein LOC134717657 n=1 Tax=Mytilus trossulus TaxID=6551 RepID=UPI003006340E